MKLEEKHHQAIHLMILDRFDQEHQTKRVAEIVGVDVSAISLWKKDEDFKAEYQHQLELYRNSFDDIRLADRRERVQVLSDLFERVPEAERADVKLKMAIIEQIRIEMGLGLEDSPATVQLHQYIGVNVPPRAGTYEEWLEQNKRMESTDELPAVTDAEFIEEGGSEDEDEPAMPEQVEKKPIKQRRPTRRPVVPTLLDNLLKEKDE